MCFAGWRLDGRFSASLPPGRAAPDRSGGHTAPHHVSQRIGNHERQFSGGPFGCTIRSTACSVTVSRPHGRGRARRLLWEAERIRRERTSCAHQQDLIAMSAGPAHWLYRKVHAAVSNIGPRRKVGREGYPRHGRDGDRKRLIGAGGQIEQFAGRPLVIDTPCRSGRRARCLCGRPWDSDTRGQITSVAGGFIVTRKRAIYQAVHIRRW
jgi:hypothetical protein